MTQENPWIFLGLVQVIYEISVPINFQGPKKPTYGPGPIAVLPPTPKPYPRVSDPAGVRSS